MRNGNRKKHGIFLELVDFSVYTYVHDIGGKKLLLSPIQDHSALRALAICKACYGPESVWYSGALISIPVNDFRKFSGFFSGGFFYEITQGPFP